MSTSLPVQSCLAPELICAYVHRLAPNEEEIAIERHLQSCDSCLLEIHAAFRIVKMLATTRQDFRGERP